MESGPRRAFTDFTSRILSILSLVVALGAVGYFYMQGNVSSTRSELITAFETQLGEQSRAYEQARANIESQYQDALARQDARMEDWNSNLNQAIAAFRQDAQSLLTQIDEAEKSASQERQVAFRRELDALTEQLATDTTADDAVGSTSSGATDTAGEPSSINAPQNSQDIADTQPEISNQSGSANLSGLADAANLKVVNTVLRPGTGNTTLIVIENDSQKDAWIDRIRFRPESDFQSTDSFDLAPDGATTSNVTTITYDTSDNTSKRPGYHGIYDRQLFEKIRVPAGERVTLRVVIHDDKYEGWGFAGKLVMDYNSDESLTVEAARVAFLGKI